MNEFKFSEKADGQNLTLAFEGMIDEDVTFPPVDTGKFKKVTIHLQGIKTINSVGIREWLNWIRPISEKSEIVLSQCPKAMVFQFNMVEGFLPPKAVVESFFVPYFCETCDQEENVLFKVGKEIEVADGNVKTNFEPSSVHKCEGGGCELEMDVTEAKYFQFLKRAAS